MAAIGRLEKRRIGKAERSTGDKRNAGMKYLSQHRAALRKKADENLSSREATIRRKEMKSYRVGNAVAMTGRKSIKAGTRCWSRRDGRRQKHEFGMAKWIGVVSDIGC